MSLLPEENLPDLTSSTDDDDYDNCLEQDVDDDIDGEDDDDDNSNSIDSLNLEDDEEECDTIGLFPLQCNLSDRVVSGSLVVQIDQAPPPSSMSTVSTTAAAFSNDGASAGERSRNGNGTSLISVGAVVIPLGTGNSNTSVSNETHPLPQLNDEVVSASASSSGPTTMTTTSDNMSTRATLGSAGTLSVLNGDDGGNNNVNGEGGNNNAADAEPDNDNNDNSNSSPASLIDNEDAERVRRIHNSIFNSLEHDLAELVRIREETIQFLENNGEDDELASARNTRISSSDIVGSGGSGGSDPLVLRERLSYHTRPRIVGATRLPRTAPSALDDNYESSSGGGNGGNRNGNSNRNAIKMNGRSYTPIANYENALPAQPAKPYVEVGLTSCDEKAIAARKILDKLQFGDPEDEAACLVRRFWRDTSVLEDSTNSTRGTGSALSVDIAAIAERTASLEASLEEAFDGLRLRLRQMRPEESAVTATNQDNLPSSSIPVNDASTATGDATGINGSSSPENPLAASAEDALNYQAWDEETSIMNNPLNYDIWNEFEDGGNNSSNNAEGSSIAARLNVAEWRTSHLRNIRSEGNITSSGGGGCGRNTSSVSVGTDPIMQNGEGGINGDDDSSDDEEMTNLLQFRNFCNNQQEERARARRELFEGMEFTQHLERELASMFTFNEQDLRIPTDIINGSNVESTSNSNGDGSDEMPLPLFPRNTPRSEEQVPQNSLQDADEMNGEESDEDEESRPAFNIPLADNRPSIEINPNREDDCSMHVYLDENNLSFNFPRHHHHQPQGQDHNRNQDGVDEE